MPGLQIPGSLCASLHPDYAGPDSPGHVLDAIVAAARQMVVRIIEAQVAPARLPETHDPGITRNVSFPAPIMAVIEDYAFDHNMQESQAIRAFLYAAIARGDAINYRVEVKDGLEPYVKAKGFGRRKEQSLLFECLTDSLSSGRIGLVEGATGIGKTLAIVAAAAEAIPSSGRVIVTAPTLQVLRDFITTHAQLNDKMDGLPLARIVFGRNEYLSRGLLEAVLDDQAVPVVPAPLREWLKQGCPAVGADVALDQPYLCSSLLHLCPDFPVEGVRLSDQTPDDDPGYQTYREQFARDESGEVVREIIYCTHAMVAVDLRRTLQALSQSEHTADQRERSNERLKAIFADRNALLEMESLAADEKAALKKLGIDAAEVFKELEAGFAQASVEHDVGILPPWQYLIIDEAHLFETNMANVLASNVSMMEFRRKAHVASSAGELSQAAAKRVDTALRRLRNVNVRSDDGLDLNQTGDQECMEARIALAEAAEAICGARRAKSGESTLMVSLRRDAAAIKQALMIAGKSARQNAARLKFSPVREFPQLSFGRRSIERELTLLWNRCVGAACVSATLYLRRSDKFSSDYIASILHPPQDRVRDYPPIRPTWSVAPVRGVWTPEKIPGWLRPPTRSDRLTAAAHETASASWYAQLATELVRIHETAAGGMLVLMTSYEAIRHVAALIESKVDALVKSEPSKTLNAQRTLYMDLAASGRKPVWLALGGAWAGLDINGEHRGIPSGEDNLLTDLVIPRLPFSLNTSVTHFHRMETRSGVPWELLDTTMRVKQGIGRLVRREGLPANRRIFVLDGRLNDPKFENFLAPIKSVLAIYPPRVWGPAG